MGGSIKTETLNIPWLDEVLAEIPEDTNTYVSIYELADIFDVHVETIRRYIMKIGINPALRNGSDTGRRTMYVTEDEAKEITRRRLKEGYVIKRGK